MNRDKWFFRHVLLHYFDLKKTAAETHRLISETYGEQAPSERTCREWFQRFRSGDFSVEDKERSGQPKKFEDAKLQALLDENQTQTLEELSKVLNVSPMVVSKRLHAMGKIQKEGKWLPHELSENAILNRLSIATSLLARQKKKVFCGAL